MVLVRGVCCSTRDLNVLRVVTILDLGDRDGLLVFCGDEVAILLVDLEEFMVAR